MFPEVGRKISPKRRGVPRLNAILRNPGIGQDATERHPPLCPLLLVCPLFPRAGTKEIYGNVTESNSSTPEKSKGFPSPPESEQKPHLSDVKTALFHLYFYFYFSGVSIPAPSKLSIIVHAMRHHIYCLLRRPLKSSNVWQRLRIGAALVSSALYFRGRKEKKIRNEDGGNCSCGVLQALDSLAPLSPCPH